MSLNELFLRASGVCAALGVFAGVGAWMIQHQLRNGLKLALEFWLAAGLLRLSADPEWHVIIAAGAIVLVRKGLGWGLAQKGIPKFNSV